MSGAETSSAEFEEARLLEAWETQGDPACQRCNGIGWVVKAPPLSRHMVYERVPCPCLFIREERERLERYEDFRHMTIDSWRGDATKKRVVESFARNETLLRFLVLKGPTGTGKTHLSVGAIKVAHEVGIVARIAYVARMWDEMRSAIDSGAFDSVFRRYAETPLLAIDDEGLENPTAWVSERWDYLINERYTLGVKTIIGTNLDTKQIPARIADRIFDAKYGVTIELSGESMRGKGKR